MFADPPLTNNDQKKPWSVPWLALSCVTLNNNAHADPNSSPFLNSFCSFIYYGLVFFGFWLHFPRFPFVGAYASDEGKSNPESHLSFKVRRKMPGQRDGRQKTLVARKDYNRLSSGVCCG
jgi:hypothetical protein